MNLQLKDKVIIITHDANNISNNISKLLINENAIPVIIGKEIIEQKNYFQISTDVPLTEAYKNVVDLIVNKFGNIDGLVNNVIQLNDVNIEHDDAEMFIQSIQTNTIDCFLLTQQILPALKKSKGAIVNITFNKKINQHNLIDERTALTREWAVDFLKHEIRVNALVIKSMNYSAENENEIANTVSFLLSERSSHTTGQIINVS